MSDSSLIQHDKQIIKELLDSISKGNQDSIVSFYELFKVEDFNYNVEIDNARKEDLFSVDLTTLSDDNLIFLHQNTNWLAPSYYLRKRFTNKWSELSDDMLIILSQTKCEHSKDELFNRYSENLNEANDEILVMMSQDDNERALEVLFERYIPIVKRIIRRLEKRFFFRGYDTDDLISEGIIGLYKSKDDFKIERKTKFKDFSRHVIEKHIGTLILRSSNYKNKVLNESFSYHSPIGNDSEVTFEHMLKSEGFLPEETYINKKTYHEIREKLTPLEENVLELYSLGLSYEEIGERVGKKKKAIDNTIQRIRKKGDNYYVQLLVAEGYTLEKAIEIVKKWKKSR